MKTAQVTHLKLPPELLERGFWIYIWQIRLPRTISDSTSGEIHCGAI